MAPLPQLGMDPWRSIAPLAALEDRLDLVDQGVVPGRARSAFRRCALPRVEPAPADTKDVAQQSDRIVTDMGSNESELRVRPWPRTGGGLTASLS